MELEIIQSGQNNPQSQLPKDWEEKKLGEVCEIELGKTPYRGNKSLWDIEKKTQNVWLSIADLLNTDNKFVYDSKEYVADKAIRGLKVVEKGTLLVSFKLTLGRLAFAGRDLFTNEAIAALSIKDEQILDKYFLYQVLSFFDWHKSAEGDVKVKGKTLNKAKLKEIPIPLPPLPEQKRIVAILDEAFEAIAKAKENTKQNLKNAKEIFESYLQLALTPPQGDALSPSNSDALSLSKWEEKKLGEVCETGSGGTPLKTHKDYYDGGTIPWLLSGEVGQGEIFTSKNFITEKGLKNSSAKLFPPNTVLVAMYGATAGQVGILRFEATTNQAVCGILPNKNFIPEFIYYKFLAGKELLVSQAVGGAQPNISQIKIKNTLVPVIPIKLQQSIVHQLDTLRAETQKLEEIYAQKLNDLEELKKSLLQKAFAGELVK